MELAKKGFGRIFGIVKGIKHDMRGCWDPEPGVTVLESDVTYTRWDDKPVTIPVLTIHRKNNDDKVEDVRLFLDPAPIFEGFAARVQVSGKYEVNPAGTKVPVTRDQIWDALVVKAKNANRFVPAISKCEVIEEGDDYIVRDAIIDGIPNREKATFYPEEKVIFERVISPEMGTIHNVIEEGEDGDLWLTFSMDLTLPGVPDGSPFHKETEHYMSTSYVNAFQNVVDALRREAAAA